MHRGCFVWMSSPPLAGRRTPHPAPVRVCACARPSWPGWAGRPPGRLLVRLTFSLCRLVFLPCWAPFRLGLTLLWFFGCPPPLFFSSRFPFSARPLCLFLSLVSGPRCLGPWRLVSPFSSPSPCVFFFFRRASPLSLAFFGFRPRVSWALARCAVCFVGLPLPGSPCALALFVVPAWLLAAPWLLLPSPSSLLWLALFVAAALCSFFFSVARPRCLWFSLVSGPGCPGPWRCVLFVLPAFRSSALRALSLLLWFLPGRWLLVGGYCPPPLFVPYFFFLAAAFCSNFFFSVACRRCLWFSLVSGPGCPGPWRCVLFLLLASPSPALCALSPLFWCLPGRWLLLAGCCPPPPFVCRTFCRPRFVLLFFLFSVARPRCLWFSLGSGPGCPGPWRCVLFVLLAPGSSALCALSPLLWFLPGRWLLLSGSCSPPPFVPRCPSCCLFVLCFFFCCAPVLSLVFFGFQPRVPWALVLSAVCFVGLPLLGSPCTLASFVVSAWLLAAPCWWPPPPPFCVSLFFSLPLCALFCFFRSAPPLSLALSGVRPRVPWALARWVCFVGLPLLGSPCALASFVFPAWPLAASWCFVAAVRCSGFVFSALRRFSPPAPLPPPWCLRGALCCLVLPRCGALPFCVLCCGASPCCVVGCCVLCGVCWGVHFRVVLRCWLLLRVVPKALLPKGKGRDVYPRVKVNGPGCVWCVRAVCKCVVALPDQCTLALGRRCLADACAQSHRVSFAHCTLRAALHHQCLLRGAALLGALHHTALCVPCCTVVVGRGQWAVELLQCTAALPGGSGQWTSCNALPHCLGAVGSAIPAMHCLTARGQWAVQLLQYTAPLPWGSGQ